MHPASRTLAPALVAAALLTLAAPVTAGAAVPTPGRYSGATGDGHLIEFTVERSAKPRFARKITHFHVVYDIAGCRSGPVRQVFFASVRTSGSPSERGRFSRLVGHTAATNAVQLRLSGRFTSPTRASGSFRVGVVGRCPLDPNAPALSFTVRRG
jgi:hypothetical protein